ncbi:hypothetical protein MASR1M45_12710 [Candidatus Kapaibacterium sp.]
MAAIELLYGESTFLRLIPTTLTDGKISALGTKIDFLRIVKVEPSFPAPASASETTYFTTEGSNNNRYSTPDKSKNYNVLDGTEISEGGGDSAYKFVCEVMVTPAQRKLLIDYYIAGTPVIGSRDLGKNAVNGNNAGYEYLLGRISELTDTPQRSPSKITFTIQTSKTIEFQGTDVDEADYNAIATGATNTLTPDNEPTHTITALTSGDWAKLILGEIVTKNAA